MPKGDMKWKGGRRAGNVDDRRGSVGVHGNRILYGYGNDQRTVSPIIQDLHNNDDLRYNKKKPVKRGMTS